MIRRNQSFKKPMFQPNCAGEFEKMKATRPFALTIGNKRSHNVVESFMIGQGYGTTLRMEEIDSTVGN
jgi:hypothetical protein